MAPDLLSTIRLEIDRRLSELRPLLAERERLLEAIDALEAAGARSDSTTLSEGDAPKSLTPVKSPRAKRAPVKSLRTKASSVSASTSESASTSDEPARRGARPRAARRGSAAGAIERAASGLVGAANGHAQPARERRQVKESAVKDRPERVARNVARETILAALDHGSHTVSELAVVTAMSGPGINSNLRKLVTEGAIVKTEREGKAAWALPETVV
jgi:hypothetical protein